MKELEKLQARIDEIQAEITNATEETERNRAEISEKLNLMQREMAEATKAGDVERYRSAKATYAELSDALEMFTARAEEFKAGRRITAEEYRETSELVMEELREEHKKLFSEVKALTGRISALTVKFYSDAEKANRLLLTWQRDFYKDPSLFMDIGNGRKNYTQSAEIRWKDYILFNLVKELTQKVDSIK